MDFLKTTYDKHTKIWSGEKSEKYFDFDCSFGKVLYSTMKNYPRNIIQISDDDGKAVTNKEALTWAIRIAQHFKKMQIKYDDIIGIAAKNSTYLMPVAVGCLLNATPFHAINPTLDEKTTTHLFGLTKPKVIFCDGQAYEKIRLATISFKPLIYTIVDHIEGVPKVEDLFEETQTELFYTPESLSLGGDQTVAILTSSGTTGMPKAVCISNHTLVADYGLVTCDDVVFGNASLDWITGIIILAMTCMKGTTRIITTKPYSPEYLVELVKKYKITYISLAPRHVAALVSCPTAIPESFFSVRAVGVGGGLTSLPTMQRLQDIMKDAIIMNGYGSTEVFGIASSFGLNNITSVGKLPAGIRVRIVDDDGKNLGPNEVGEIYVHNGHHWNGYYRNPIETQRMYDNSGWFRMGDLGYMDEDNFLYIVDRKKEIIKYQGMQYWPAEIEDAIAELPQVNDVCVVGVYSETNGDAAGAVIVKATASSLSEQDVKDHVAKRFSMFYKHLHAGVLFVDRLPQNNNGKTNKKEAKLLFTTSVVAS